MYDAFRTQCVCAPYYTKNTIVTASLTCVPCTSSDPLCKTCTFSSTSTTCSACTENAALSETCTCNTGFYRSGSLCVPCGAGCTTCTSATSCSACLASTNLAGNITRGTATTGCLCLPGFYQEASNPICSTCSSICKTCSTSATTCTSCEPAKGLVLSGSTCACVEGTYLLTTSSGSSCVPCSSKCKTCSGSANSCLTCDAAKFR